MTPHPTVDYAFFKKLEDQETGPYTTDFDRLIRMGISLPDPDRMREEELHQKLWEVIEGLSALRVFLHNTDHMSDKDLYTYLWTRGLREEVEDQPPDDRVQMHLDILGGCSEEDLNTYLRYYADEAYRDLWITDFPEDNVPPHEDPPYDRDRDLPTAY